MSLWSDAIGYGTHAARPAAGRPGALYFELDTGNGYRDSGTGWDWIVGVPLASHLAVQTMSATDLAVSVGNTLVLNAGTGRTATLPAAAAASGQMVLVKNLGNTCHVIAASGDALESDAATPYPVLGSFGAAWFICDGTTWYVLSHMSAP